MVSRHKKDAFNKMVDSVLFPYCLNCNVRAKTAITYVLLNIFHRQSSVVEELKNYNLYTKVK